MSANEAKDSVGASSLDLGAKSPITEALVDFQVSLPSDVGIEKLEQLHHLVEDQYPGSKVRRRWTQEFKFRGGEPAQDSKPVATVDGCVFSSEDDRQIVQFRLDGFTFSRLSPYQGWDQFVTEARRLWEIYIDGAEPLSVQRLALRYINRLELLHGADLDDYFTVGPRIPDGLLDQLAGYTGRLQVWDKDRSAYAILTLATERDEAVTLDIDTFSVTDVAPDSTKVWSIVDDLRAYKNEIFFGSITNRMTDSLLAGRTK